MTKTMITTFDELMKYAAGMPEKRVVVVNPRNEETFSAVGDALRVLKTRFILPGDRQGIAQALKKYDIRESSVEVLDAPDVDQALSMAVPARTGRGRGHPHEGKRRYIYDDEGRSERGERPPVGPSVERHFHP